MWVCGESLAQVEEFKYLRVLFTSEGKLECEIDRWISSAVSTVMQSNQFVVVKKELGLSAPALDLPVDLHSYPHLWSRALGKD